MPLLNSLKDKISARLDAGDTVVIGVSGGPDSVFLLSQLLHHETKPNIIICHVNYHLRGWASNSDQHFVEELAKKHNLIIELLHAESDIRQGNLEENCRKLRYGFFEKIRQKYQAKFILTAHHLNDQVETFLLNLTRGSTFKGFFAMPEFDQERRLWRPLLDIPKAKILTWLKENKQKFRMDQSNSDYRLSRNLIRSKIIPQFQKINPNFLQTIASSIQHLQENLQVIEQSSQLWLKNHFHQERFELKAFLELSPALQKQVLRTLYQEIHKKSLTVHTVAEILNTLSRNKSGLKKEFGPATFLKVKKDLKTQKRLVVIERNLN